MADEKKGDEKPTTQQNDQANAQANVSKPPKADEKKGDEKPTTGGAKRTPTPEADEDVAPKPRNLTREQLEGFLHSTSVRDGMDPKQAAAHAKKRAAEMVRDTED